MEDRDEARERRMDVRVVSCGDSFVIVGRSRQECCKRYTYGEGETLQSLFLDMELIVRSQPAKSSVSPLDNNQRAGDDDDDTDEECLIWPLQRKAGIRIPELGEITKLGARGTAVSARGERKRSSLRPTLRSRLNLLGRRLNLLGDTLSARRSVKVSRGSEGANRRRRGGEPAALMRDRDGVQDRLGRSGLEFTD